MLLNPPFTIPNGRKQTIQTVEPKRRRKQWKWGILSCLFGCRRTMIVDSIGQRRNKQRSRKMRLGSLFWLLWRLRGKKRKIIYSLLEVVTCFRSELHLSSVSDEECFLFPSTVYLCWFIFIWFIPSVYVSLFTTKGHSSMALDRSLLLLFFQHSRPSLELFRCVIFRKKCSLFGWLNIFRPIKEEWKIFS